MITIKYYDNGALKTKSVQEDDSSFRYRAIMGDDSITLKFTLAEAIDFPVGTFVEFQGSTYTLTSPENWSRYGNQNIEYTMLLNGISATLGKYKLRNQQDGRLKFSMCTTPSEFLDLIVDNLNQTGRSSGWTAQCNIDTTEQKTIEFNHIYLIDALKSLADTYKTEYEITSGKVIKLGKVEYNKVNPLSLSYGKGNGFKAGTGRANSNDSKPIEILYVQGGERNIDRSKYGSAELHLPKNKTLEYEGRTYVSDADGLSIRRYGVTPKYGNEDSFDGSEVYPKRIGTVSSVTVVDADAHFYDFADSSILNNLDYNNVLIDGETMTVIFQTGMLAGREFEISKYDHNSRTFEIVPQELEGILMPDNTWKPAVGDTYIIYGCTLPDAYIADDDTETGAEWDLFREAARNMYENEDFKFTFSGELQGKWAKEHWDNVGGKLIIGGYIRFSDTYFAPQGVDIRIVGIKEFLGDPYSPIIEISNSIASAGAVESALREASNQEVKISSALSNSLSFTKRRFRDAQETIKLLGDAFDDKFTKGINPVSIQTMSMLVGDERLQFKVYNTSFSSTIAFPAIFANGVLSISACGIKHFTLGVTDTAITSEHSDDSYKKWVMAAQQLTPADAASAYYLYAKVSRTSSNTASFELSTDVKSIDGTTGYYYLLVGILSSADEGGTRGLAPLYGYTNILPNQILTGSVRSADGNTVLDLETGILSLNSNSSVAEQGAGINGNPSLSDIAAWFGGPMADKEATPTPTNYAASLFRFDGTGYLAKGNIRWDANGYGWVGGSGVGEDYAVKWNNNGIYLGTGIKIAGDGQETLSTLLSAVQELQSWFGKDGSGNIYVKRDSDNNPRNFYAFGDVAGGGPGQGGQGGASAITIPLTSDGTTVTVELTREEIAALHSRIRPDSTVVFTFDEGTSIAANLIQVYEDYTVLSADALWESRIGGNGKIGIIIEVGIDAEGYSAAYVTERTGERYIIRLKENQDGTLSVDGTPEEVIRLYNEIGINDNVSLIYDGMLLHAFAAFVSSDGKQFSGGVLAEGGYISVFIEIQANGASTGQYAITNFTSLPFGDLISIIHQTDGWHVQVRYTGQLRTIYDSINGDKAASLFINAYNLTEVGGLYTLIPAYAQRGSSVTSNQKKLIGTYTEKTAYSTDNYRIEIVLTDTDGTVTSSVTVEKTSEYDDIVIPIVLRNGTYVADITSQQASNIGGRLNNGKYDGIYITFPDNPFGTTRISASVNAFHHYISATYTFSDTDGIHLLSIRYLVGAPSVNVNETILTPITQ